MILGDVEETVTTVVIDDETYEEIYKVGYVALKIHELVQKITKESTTLCCHQCLLSCCMH